MWHFSAHGWLLFQSLPLLTQWAGASFSPQHGMRWGGSDQDLPLRRPHSGTQEDLSATTAPHVILINLARIQIRQASVSLQQNTIPHVSQVSKMDLLLCCFSQKCSCDFSVFGGLSQNSVAGNKNWEWLTESVEMYRRKKYGRCLFSLTVFKCLRVTAHF